jgi:integrase
MARPKKTVPSYLRHPSGRARVAWTDSAGVRRFKLLPGEYDSPESKAAYRTFLAELEAAPHAHAAGPSELTVNELLLAYLDHAERYYVDPDGKPTDALRHARTACRFVRESYGHAPAASFGPLALKAVRQRFVGAGWCRGTVNAQAARVVQVFKWAAAEELVPASVYQALKAVPGLRKGRGPARETEPVRPVDDAVVDATLPFLTRPVRGLVEFQRLTGCRPGEGMAIRRCDIDESGAVWLYRPRRHKTAHKGKSRVVAIGPKAQELLTAYFTDDPDDYLFSPRREAEERLARRSAERKTPRWASHMKRNERKRVGERRKCAPRDRYRRESYLTAVERACDRAFPPPPPLAQERSESRAKWWARLTDEQKESLKAWRRAHRWHPYQLRHAFATKVRKEFDLEAAQVLLGHERCDVTQVYAERNEGLASRIAAQIG